MKHIKRLNWRRPGAACHQQPSVRMTVLTTAQKQPPHQHLQAHHLPRHQPNHRTASRKDGEFEAELKDKLEQASEKRQSSLSEATKELRQKLDDAKKKVCENHQTTINHLMGLMDKPPECVRADYASF